MRFNLLLGAIALLAATPSQAAPEVPPTPQKPSQNDRASTNYEAILRGEKTLFGLTPAEQDEVRALDRRIRAQPPLSGQDAYERCIDDEYARLGREPSALDQRTIETRCR